MTGDVSVLDLVQQRLTSEQLQLPVFAPVAMQLQDMLASDNFDITRVAAKITEDQALTSQLLRVANSSFYAGLNKVATIKQAFMRLGAQQVTNIVMLVSQQPHYSSRHQTLTRFMKSLWAHAIGCALGAKWLAENTGHQALAQEAFLGGLLHDIGKLFLLKVLDDIALSGQYPFALSDAVIAEVTESLHTKQGALLLQQWNLPEPYCIVSRDHHLADYDTHNVLLTLVRLVNLACHKLGLGLQHDPSTVLAATVEAQALGISEIGLAELEIKLEDAMGLANG